MFRLILALVLFAAPAFAEGWNFNAVNHGGVAAYTWDATDSTGDSAETLDVRACASIVVSGNGAGTGRADLFFVPTSTSATANTVRVSQISGSSMQSGFPFNVTGPGFLKVNISALPGGSNISSIWVRCQSYSVARKMHPSVGLEFPVEWVSYMRNGYWQSAANYWAFQFTTDPFCDGTQWGLVSSGTWTSTAPELTCVFPSDVHKNFNGPLYRAITTNTARLYSQAQRDSGDGLQLWPIGGCQPCVMTFTIDEWGPALIESVERAFVGHCEDDGGLELFDATWANFQNANHCVGFIFEGYDGATPGVEVFGMYVRNGTETRFSLGHLVGSAANGEFSPKEQVKLALLFRLVDPATDESDNDLAWAATVGYGTDRPTAGNDSLHTPGSWLTHYEANAAMDPTAGIVLKTTMAFGRNATGSGLWAPNMRLRGWSWWGDYDASK